MDENLEELYDNLADPDDEEYYDSEDDEVEDEEYDEEDNIAEDPGDDEDWWHSGEDNTIEVVDTSEYDGGEEPYTPGEDDWNDESSIVRTVTEEIDPIMFTDTSEIEAATTGDELFDAIADAIESVYDRVTFGGMRCNIEFISTEDFEALPDEEKYPSIGGNNEYEDTSDDEEDDDDDGNYEIRSLSDLKTIYFIYDYEGEQ